MASCLIEYWYVGAQPPTNVMAEQISLYGGVRVTWTAPPGRYLVTADPGGVSVDNSFPSQIITIQQPGVYNISVMSFSQHYGGTAGPVEVTVRCE